MKNLEKFRDESLELNQLIHLKGGDKDCTLGGDASGCFDYEDTGDGSNILDVMIHQYNDDNSYNGYYTATG
jgi:hypothetical protein